MIKRYSTAAVSALGITFLLFLGMHFLIAPPSAERPEPKKGGPIVIGEVREVNPVYPDIIKPDRPQEQEIKPDLLPPPTEKTGKPTNIGPDFTAFKPPVNTVPRKFALADGDMQSIRKIAPTYPRNMISKGIEGYAIVKFTVNKRGAVENAEVIETTHAGFNRASIKAVLRFKYKPRVIDGIAIPVNGVMEKVSFVIEDS